MSRQAWKNKLKEAKKFVKAAHELEDDMFSARYDEAIAPTSSTIRSASRSCLGLTFSKAFQLQYFARWMMNKKSNGFKGLHNKKSLCNECKLDVPGV